MTEKSAFFKDAFLWSWDGYPAVSFSTKKAIALLAPGQFWMPVDALDVRHTAKVITTGQHHFKEEFAALYEPPVETAADWYYDMNPHQDLLSLYWSTEA